MGLASPPQLSLDLKPPSNNHYDYLPTTISGFLREVSIVADASERLHKVDDFLARLEQEYMKIQVFQRELPLCMLLLNDAILALKEESKLCRTRNTENPVVGEFIPLKKESRNKVEDEDSREKKDWLSSVQLWSFDDPANDSHTQCPEQNFVQQSSPKVGIKRKRIALSSNDLIQCHGKKEEELRPIKGSHIFPMTLEEVDTEAATVPVAGLSLLTPGIKHSKQELTVSNLRFGNGRLVANSSSFVASCNGQSNAQQHSASRKQRRCWSPELHRRFVNALQQLGGAQVATPKHIRELMQVEGLTNDEVKSHLQKYRLHTRRALFTSATLENQSSQDQSNEALKPSGCSSGSPQSPFHFGLAKGGTSTTAGESMEDDEDSEGY